MNKKMFNVNNKRHSVNYTNFNKPTAHLRSDYHIKDHENNKYYKLDDFDNPNGWAMQDIDMFSGMGFNIQGDTHMELNVPGENDSYRYTVAMHKDLGPELKINERKHYFKSLEHMMKKIDELGKLDI
jgi:hypothetical protein